MSAAKSKRDHFRAEFVSGEKRKYFEENRNRMIQAMKNKSKEEYKEGREGKSQGKEWKKFNCFYQYP